MIAQVKEAVAGLTSFARLLESTRKLAPADSVVLTGLSGSLPAVVFSCLHGELGRQSVVIARDRATAERWRDDLIVSTGREAVEFFAGSLKGGTGDGGGDVSDIQALRSMLRQEEHIIVTHPRAFLSSLPPPTSLADRLFTLVAGNDVPLTDLVDSLQRLGFQRKDFVETCGDYAQRGGILDIFPFAGENPVRLEFLGDLLESIREFDSLSQRSIRELVETTIVADLLHSVDPGNDASEPTNTIFDYVREDALLILDEPELIHALFMQESPDSTMPLLAYQELIRRMGEHAQIQLQTIGTHPGGRIDFRSVQQPAINTSVKVLRTTITAFLRQESTVIISCDSPSEQQRLKELLRAIELDDDDTNLNETERETVDLARVSFSLDPLHEGFVIPECRLAYFTEHQIFNRLKRRGRKRVPAFKGFTGRDLLRLRKGDYVVHRDYGIGRFDSLRRIQVNNVEQEVVRVYYEENDTLYVNLNYINRLQKYSSREGHVPKLSRLGSSEWGRLKSRAKKRVKDIARELISLYARRRRMPGFAFPKDAPWQGELEAAFMYEDTFDQAKATREVKQDMEEAFPMDRLICGDVGFGKTEVAVRAAFKAALGGKQTAVLVPTTILALQHYNTFVDRTSRYGVNIQMLSRFKSRKAQLTILDGLKSGAVDVVIGTHRLLSGDVRFKDLGLLIVDEEHRFGVSAKERLRQLRTEVDTLALTATPIPRTLHFSLMGARDLSIIATPPRNRLPIITEITHSDDDLVREAVMREVNRSGQVYVVHDRVQNIDEITERIRSLVPGVRVRYAHGQMASRELEEVMLEFLERKFDVLVATKIIESGLDIPNVNTIVVNRADRFGMAELYQLRGRVGRSNIQAFAYLLAPPVSVMPTAALQRLRAMQEFTELGSGFNLAMRDLEIRGAGNLLGREQSGFIEDMGFEMYTKVLEEAMQEIKQDEFGDLFRNEQTESRRPDNTVVDVDFDAYIPESYVANSIERLTIYRRLYDLATSIQLQELGEELKDRFGTHPPEARNLFGAIAIRIAAGKIGFAKVSISGSTVELEFPPEEDTRFYDGEGFQRIMSIISELHDHGAHLKKESDSLRLVFGRSLSLSSTQTIGEVLTLLKRLAGG
jgi:transcription-repair coupling factor (superfamily II helicase)